jgi:ADP-ribose pyrophosphatase YjhB (NUDIX family)
MMHRFNTDYEDGNCSVVSWHLEGDETVIAAAFKEIKEEVGVEVIPENIYVFGVMHRKSDDERVDFLPPAKNWYGEPANREHENCDEMGWYELDMLPVNSTLYEKSKSLSQAGSMV